MTDCPSSVTRGRDARFAVKLRIARESHHHHAAEILHSHPFIRDDVAGAVSSIDRLRFGWTPWNNGYRRYGMDTDEFNNQLRRGLVEPHTPRWRGEVGWTYELPSPVWIYSTDNRKTHGFEEAHERFDLACVDEHLNAQRFWNMMCDYGHLPEANRSLVDKLAPKFIRSHWDGPPKYECTCLRDAVKAGDFDLPDAFDIDAAFTEKRAYELLRDWGRDGANPPRIESLEREPVPTALGEVQLGNWALAYRDVGRLLAVRQQFEQPIKLFFVVTLTGCAHELISSGTVSYDGVQRVYDRLGPDVPVPTWIVGLDVDHSGPPHPKAREERR